ncbi:penicillin acylase family protein [Pontibacillus litoralis]|uniref:Beta-lactam antibiotic acylase n=1 Tax=Pontibacillus litoralis JSM 072002 TaxID=1385512 RepID=A0A0A5FWJ6_9BACI|nr:penicillin acylase family protein [Pontibacillus litoralis]KGX84299.1 beta-lactam antibiotic acylase [Pontibacillus litoralis JSM 072002]
MEVIPLPRRKKGWRTWQKVSLIVTLVLGFIVVGGLLFLNSWINRSLPQVEGEVAINGLHASVEVIRDANGVPHIKAENEWDLYRAQGFIQAQDRLFQMDMARRQASGQLSEVVGSATVTQDKYFRALGLRRAAQKSYEAYSQESKEILQAYADGVNAYITQAEENNRLPVEFTLMGNSPEPWTPLDSLTIGKYMAFDLGGHWERQAFHYYLLQTLPKEKALELFSTYPEQAPTIIQEAEIDVASLLQQAVIPHSYNGSNNWVVSGEKTASGKPLLADDPHLGLATPSIWYEMHLSSPEQNVSGVIFAGVPGIILGHNDSIAWGVTNTGPDVQQLYIEKRHPDQPNEFLFEGEYEEAAVIEEPIKVKGEGTVAYEVMETRHGPIISQFAEASGEEAVLSLRWTALDATAELEAIIEMNKATNWNQFERALEKFEVPAQNFVFASQDGTIAYKANGKIPIYSNGDDALLPLEGWKAENEWDGYIPWDELPRVVNPDKGYIATANNKVVGEDYPYHISNNWAQPYRYKRIAQVLEQGDDFTAAEMKNLQMDQHNLQGEEFVPIFLEHVDQGALSDEEQKAIAILKEWNYVDAVDGAAPLIFHTWMQTFSKQLYEEDIPEEMIKLFNGRAQTTDELIRQAHRGEEVIWIEEQGGLRQALTIALEETVAMLSEQYGSDATKWKWGDYHQVSFEHPLSSVSYLERFFNPKDPIPVGGSKVTVMAAAYEEDTGIVDHGASWRFVADTADLTQASHTVSPGQAGHFRSEWYHNQRDQWVTGEYHQTKVKQYEGSVLMLQPKE